MGSQAFIISDTGILPDRAEAPDILFIEDNRQDAELMLRSLEVGHVSAKVALISDGAEALDYLCGTGSYSGKRLHHGPKVIFLDLNLPKVDGLEVLRKIKTDIRTKLIPVVVLTSSNQDRDIMASYRLGASSYIVKPVDFDQFSKAVCSATSYWLETNQAPERSG